MRAGPPSHVSTAPRGFTLIELIVVVAIVGSVLVMVPSNLNGFGARSRLESSANTVSSVETAAKEQAVIDDHEVILEYHLYDAPADSHGKWSGWRYVIASKTHETPDAAADAQAAGTAKSRVAEEDEWVELPWDRLPEGVRLAGFSVSKEEWNRSPPGTIRVSFFPDGSVRPAHALRIESTELPRGAASTMTVRVNALTGLAEVLDGEVEMTPKRDPSDFR